MRDIAESLGVSRQLVSLVLRGAAGPSADSRERVLAAASTLGYRPNASARQLRQQRTGLLGVAFAVGHPFQSRVVERMIVRAAERGYHVVPRPMVGEHPSEDAIAALLEERVEAMAVFNGDPTALALADARARVPIVWLGEWSRDDGVDNVHVDEVGGLRAAVAHLVGLGHRRIAYIGGDEGHLGRDRAAAYAAAMEAVGLGDHVDVIPSGFDEESGADAARLVLTREDAPTALVCCGDQVAVAVLSVLALARIPVPARISVVGFDDSPPAALSYHRLTSVHQDVELTVEATLDTLLERLEGSDAPRRRISTPATLIVRDSTGPVPTSKM
ncbi:MULTISPECIES: LacI family DNA-binding transcriptional regulator [unclassified Rathayibacter]|uniref:LacI family DNA-binding transcriptional regulator n=1 Tax=unclassified Rathayibacter TaxID=2609250 RepID=UPI00104EB8FE|nr:MULTISPECIES: LacI family DNA-binding transcriptional regulator [unclassified Rathayibacter]MCJ1675546.1 LacI family transcriptional regulator [Rathayibacter sp. VKM Ac-2929]TCL79492.1 LacI family transcriptional regulator [Rathayibacter sp. PhB192]TCM25239.1 LacI family transcriptional regulator [Rathayibacter sp. PhB179]